MTQRFRVCRSAACALLVAAWATAVRAQTPDAALSFTLATSQVFSTRERPAITLVFRGVDHLDFRVYRVNDAFAFFAKLRDPHELGSEAPIVPQERTWLERIAVWKADRRADLRAFVRRQFSSEYRRARRAREDVRQVVLRRTVDVNTFAQVPLLNRSQLVTSWRELLPPVRDAEFRRVPLDLPSPGVYVVEAVNAPLKAYTVVVVSDVGLVTKTAPGQLLVFAADRFSGDPMAGCRVRVLADQQEVADGTTATDGTFQSQVVTAGQPDNLIAIAQCGSQTAATDPGAYTVRQPVRDLVGYIYSDRPVYRPGDVVHYRGVLRWRAQGALLPLSREPVEVTVVDEKEKVVRRDRKPVDEFGAVAGSLTVPPAASLGYYTVRVASGEYTATGSFEVQEYRKPEFDVAVRPQGRFAMQGGRVTATIAARYYFGQPVAGASVKYVVHRRSYFSPLRYDGAGEEDENDGGGDDYAGEEQLEGTARLNDQGTVDIAVPLGLDDHGRDYTARVEARVTDSSGREVAGAASVNATYGRYLLVARTERYVYPPGGTARLDVRAVDYDGTPQGGTRIHVALERLTYKEDEPSPTVTALQASDMNAGDDGRASWSFPVPREPGSYRVRVTGPSEGREVSDETFLWVPGSAAGSVSEEQVLELVADRRSYQPGDTARLVVRGSEFNASVLVTKENQHVSFHQVVRARSNEAIDVPIADDDVGDTYVSIAFLKDDRLYRAERRLAVPAAQHQLAITAVADRPIVRPGEPGVFTLHVAGADGAPVLAQLSVGLVDEAVYGVRPDATPDPLRFFYRREFNAVDTSFSHDYSFVGYSGTEQLLLARRHRPLTLADFKAERPDRPRVRKDFPDTVFWAADVTTNAAGDAQVRVDYPDSLTSWRFTVRAVTMSTDVGATTAHTTTTKDLILRVVTPRFLTEGDQVSIPAIVHNYLPDQKSVSLSLSADGLRATDVTAADAAKVVPVRPNGQQRVDWRFKADQVRQITVTGKATTDVAGDAMQVSLPVLPAGLERSTGSSGSIVDAGQRAFDLTVPAAANPSARSIRVWLAPSLAGAMFGALDYLTSYPWGCTEQTLSSFVPNLVVLRAMAQMQIPATERLQRLDRQIDEGLKRVYDYQHPDGGWGWWKTDQNQPFMTAYALDGLLQARDNEVTVEDWRLTSAARALGRLYARYPRALPDLKAYEVYVLARAVPDGREPDAADEAVDLKGALDDLWSTRSRMTASGRALLLLTLDLRKDARADALARELIDAAQTQGDLAWWPVASDPLLDDIVDTTVEATGLALKALSARDARNPLLERAARWLVVNRAGGYWISTKQTALALEGLLAYMRARGERPAPFTADVFVNGARAGSHSFDAASLAAPDPVLMESAAATGANAVRIVKQGAGTLYYDARVRYYDRPAAAERTGSRRLALVRHYFTLSPVERSGRIVYRERPFDGTARPGDLILVRLAAAGSTDWRYLMIEDPIPAGTEPVAREDLYELEHRQSWWFGSQREFRDDRTVFFLSDFAQGRYDLSYLLKVTTPGVFSAMPARISPMYVPDVSASSEVITMTVIAEGAP
jgi:alpha-2-macroglobulin